MTKCSKQFPKSLKYPITSWTSQRKLSKKFIPKGRYGNDRGGAIMRWVQESNPNFDMKASSKLYENVQIAVEANREEYFVEQKKLIDMRRSHSTFIKQFPARLFLNVEEIEITVVTSTITEKVYQDGKDDDIELFPSK
jgi:hypothetical protein